MTDARYPESWLNDRKIVRLSDAAFRLFVTTLAWAASNRTDGHLDRLDLDLIHGVDPQHATELVYAGLWTDLQGAYRINDYAKTQTTKAQLEGLDQKREQERVRKARQRARDRGQPEPDPDPEEGTVPRDIPPDIHRDTKDRQGQDRQEGQGRQETSASEASWPSVAPLGGAASADAPALPPTTQVPRVPRCSVCTLPLISPLDLADGVCAACDNAAHKKRKSA